MENSDDIESLKKIWTLQLYKEFDEISYYYRVRMNRPLIQILELQSRWGHWDARTRTLAIARRLIVEHSWNHVIEVFKHEMAHQYVDEVLCVQDGHGEHFHQACERLGVESWARKSEIHSTEFLKDLMQKQVSDEENILMRRVERLLALAQSSNEHEALAAMNKVSELHEKYHLDQLKKQEIEEFETIIIDHKLCRLPGFHGTLASILTSHFSVQVVFSSLYDQEKKVSHKVIELLGRVELVKLAEYVYWFLYNTLKILWTQYQKLNGARGLAARNTYYSGVLNGFEKKMRDTKTLRQKKEAPLREDRSLLVLGEQRLATYVKQRHPRLHKVQFSQMRHCAKIYEDGLAKGKELTIHGGLKHSPAGSAMKYIERSRL